MLKSVKLSYGTFKGDFKLLIIRILKFFMELKTIK